MPNGKPGDHPITDVTIHNRVVLGDPWDSELRGIVDLLGTTALMSGSMRNAGPNHRVNCALPSRESWSLYAKKP
jgi:hypothetical protein